MLDCAAVCEFDGGAFDVVAAVFAVVFAVVELLLLAAGLSADVVVVAADAAAVAGGGAVSEAVSAILLDKKETVCLQSESANNEGRAVPTEQSSEWVVSCLSCLHRRSAGDGISCT